MDTLVLDVDQAAALEQNIHFDDERIIVEEVQDVEDILENNQAEFAAVDERSPFGELRKVASIPWAVYMQLQRDGILAANGQPTDQSRFAKWLNDRDNLKFRTRPGRV